MRQVEERGPANRCTRLTTRELQVGRLIEDGLTNREAAKALGITVGTVKNHLWSAYRKTGAENRVQLAHWLRSHAAADAVGGCTGGSENGA